MSDGHESQPSTSSGTIQWTQPCRQFDFQEIRLATHDFDESLVIGRGGFGKVYRGTIYNGSTLIDSAIKRLDSESPEGPMQFWAEVETLSKLRHCHLVSLLGFCNHETEMILVYEYMPNGTLEDHLHKLGTPLSWLQRLNICIGAARGLDYLHTGAGIEFRVIHRDVKSSNILLNETWAAKISDFGLSISAPTNGVDTLVKGTFGYLDPDYYYTGRLTRKSDVYAFGVVLLEVLCRKRAVDASLDEDQWNLVRWAQESIKERKLKHIVDYDISGQISPKCLKQFVGIAERCLLSNSKQRPTMAEVVVGLKSARTLQKKVESSMHHAGRPIFGRILDKFPLPSKREISDQGDSKASSNVKRNNTSKDNRMSILKESKFPVLKEYEFDDLKRATNNFSEDLMRRKGRYVREYLGRFENNDTFDPSIHVIKRFLKGKVEEWVAEMKLLGQLAHPNIISLLGYCSDSEHERFLVYEYMQNGNFDRCLHGEAADGNIAEPLSWGTRLAIMIGVARGLAYLHSFDIVHRDVKSSSVLMDQDFNAKLADIDCVTVLSLAVDGITNLATLIMGTMGYLDPAYMETGRVNVKSDIYSFGVLLLETLTGCKPIDRNRPEELRYLLRWALPYLEERSKLKEIMDPRLEGSYPLEGAFECTALARSCVADEPKDRPSSEEVLRRLEEIHAVHNWTAGD